MQLTIANILFDKELYCFSAMDYTGDEFKK